MAGRLSESDTEVSIDDTDEAPESTTNLVGKANSNATESQYNGIMVTSTPEFKAALKTAAEAADKSLSAFIRDILATEIGYDGPMSKETTRKRKYSSEAEREAAQKTRNKNRRDVIKSLLEKYGDEFKAQLEDTDDE